jgi:putative chitinase
VIDAKVFFVNVRHHFGKLNQSQVNGFNVLLSKWEEDYADDDPRFLANPLATAWHETGGAMQAIVERGKKSYFNKYEPTTRLGKSLGNTKKGDGFLFRGRGLVQITGRSNYSKFGIADTPEKALDPETSAHILFAGMREGRFTGRKLADYFNKKVNDPIGARAIVNGSDNAVLIAGYHARFLSAILAAHTKLDVKKLA